MEIQINEKTKVDITSPTKVVGEKAYQGNFQLIKLSDGVWVKEPTIRPVVIYFDNITYDQFRLGTTKQKYRYFIQNLQLEIDENYFSPETKAIELIQASKINESLKTTLINDINIWVTANP